MNKCLCSRPAGDAFLCGRCLAELEQDLAEVPFLIRELEVVLTRQTVYAPRSDGGRSSIKPLPFHVAASDTRQKINRALERWAKALIVDSCPRSGRPEHTSAFLLGRLNQIGHHESAIDIAKQISEPIGKARWLIDRPADKWYAGPCNNEILVDGGSPRECGQELYAKTGAVVVECQACEAQFDVKARREWLLQAAEDHLANASTIARAVTWLGEEQVTPHRVAMWVKRKRLVAKGHEPYGDSKNPDRTRPLYRVGDVLDLLAETATAKRETP